MIRRRAMTVWLVTSAAASALHAQGPGPASAPAREGAKAEAPAPSTKPDGLSALIIDEELISRRGTVLTMDGAHLVFRDEQGRERRAPVNGLAAIVAQREVERPTSSLLTIGGAKSKAGPSNLGPRRGGLVLTDGQRFPGNLAPTPGDADALTWQHPVFGLMPFPLDSIARYAAPPTNEVVPAVAGEPSADAGAVAAEDGAPDRAEDELVLVNGDRLRGFIAGMGQPVQIEVGGEVVSIVRERIASASLSNPPSRATDSMVWLSDGTVAAVKRAVSSGSSAAGPLVALTLPGGQSGSYLLGDVRGVAFDRGNLWAISSLTMLGQRPTGGRPSAEPVIFVRPDEAGPRADADVLASVPLDAYDAVFPGPMEVTWELPEGSRRAAGRLELDASAGAWADCEISIRVDDEELWRSRLARRDTTAAPAAVFNIRAAGQRLTLVIEPGRYGPIMDRVVLRDGLVLVGK